jgi:hypothetical protein
MTKLSLYLSAFSACLLPGCTWFYGPGPTVTKIVTAPSTAIQLAPQSLSFTAATSATQTITVSENGYSGAFSASGCTGIATTAWPGSGSLNVTEVGGGACVLTITDANNNVANAVVSVTSVFIPIESGPRK